MRNSLCSSSSRSGSNSSSYGCFDSLKGSSGSSFIQSKSVCREQRWIELAAETPIWMTLDHYKFLNLGSSAVAILSNCSGLITVYISLSYSACYFEALFAALASLFFLFFFMNSNLCLAFVNNLFRNHLGIYLSNLIDSNWILCFLFIE